MGCFGKPPKPPKTDSETTWNHLNPSKPPVSNGFRWFGWFWVVFGGGFGCFRWFKVVSGGLRWFGGKTTHGLLYKIRPDLLLSKLAYSDVTMHVEPHCSNHKLDEVEGAFSGSHAEKRIQIGHFYGFFEVFRIFFQDFQDFRPLILKNKICCIDSQIRKTWKNGWFRSGFFAY